MASYRQTFKDRQVWERPYAPDEDWNGYLMYCKVK